LPDSDWNQMAMAMAAMTMTMTMTAFPKKPG